jgi:hypothetical protein
MKTTMPAQHIRHGGAVLPLPLRDKPPPSKAVLAALSAFIMAATAAAATTETEAVLIKKEVTATPDQPGKYIVDEETVRMTPSPSGTLEETLRRNSAVQFDLNARSSETPGDLTPPRISIFGAPFYANAFLINGINNNNLFNPSGTLNGGDGVTVSPSGEAQSTYINPDLVDSITLYTSNIPVEYGGFTGGVIDAKIRDPKHDRLHASARFDNYTSDSWARQKFADNVDPDRSVSSTHQPRFTRYSFSFDVEGPLAEHVAGLLSYSEKRSVMPIWTNLTQTPPLESDNVSTNRNVLLKLSTVNLDTVKASVTAAYTPFEREWQTAVRRDSKTATIGGGHSLVLDGEKHFSFGTLTANLSYNHSDVSREGTSNRTFTWKSSPSHAYANWNASSSAMEGGAGNYEQQAAAFGAKAMLVFNAIGGAFFKNTFKVGGEVGLVDATRKTQGAETYSWLTSATSIGTYTPLEPQITATATGSKENGVITGEQWLNYRAVYDPTDKNVRFTTAAAYMEDEIKIGRATVRPALRVSHETLVGNTDLDPRLFANIDTMNNGRLNIYAGASRYHNSAPFLNYELYNGQGFRREARQTWDDTWHTVSSSAGTNRAIGDVKTPYSDEFNMGATLNAAGIEFGLQGVLRNQRDLIRSNTVNGIRVHQNTGRTDYKGLVFSAGKKRLEAGAFGRHNILLSATLSKTESNSRAIDWEELDNATYSTEYAFYKNEFVSPDTLPANNFNSPFVVSLSDTASFWRNRLRVMNNFYFGKGGDGVTSAVSPAGDLAPDGKRYYKYTERRYGNQFFWDLSLEFDALQTPAGTLTFNVRVLNLLNRHNLVNTTESDTGGTYTMGRQFFAGVKYSY